MSRQYKKYSTGDGLPIQVESAIRDGSGKNIENNYAKQDGSYDTMNVGHAESSSSLDTNIGVDDQTPFNYQTAGGDSDITTGIQNLKKLVGASVVFNQLVKNGNFENTDGWETSEGFGTQSVIDNELSYTIVGLANYPLNNHIYRVMDIISGHKYLSIVNVLPLYTGTLHIVYGSTYYAATTTLVANSWNNVSSIFTASGDANTYGFQIPTSNDDYSIGDIIKYRRIELIDLTQMFGSQVADYIYAKEQANVGDGVAIFKSMFPNDYYAYNTGTFIHSQSAKLKMVDYNQWDEQWELGTLDVSTGLPVANNDTIRSKNFNECLPNTDYYGYIPASYTSEYALAILFYDNEENFISAYYRIKNGVITSPSNAHYFKICTMFYGTTYKNDICIFIYWDGSRIGYEPYQEHIYDLPNDELKGILKVVNNKIVADGDEEYPDGTKKVRYGYVDLGTKNWSVDSEGKVVYADITGIKRPNFGTQVINAIIPNYETSYQNDVYGNTSDRKIFSGLNWIDRIQIHDNSLLSLTPEQIKQALSGVYLVYELAEETETTSTAFAENIYVDDFGTMEFLDENNARISGIQGNEIFYKANISGFAESLYVKVEGDPEEYVTQEELATTVANINNTINAMAIENTKKFNAIDNRLLVLENIVDTVYSVSFTGNSTTGTRGGRGASLVGETLADTIANFMAEPFFSRIQVKELPALKSDGTPIYDTDGETPLKNKMVFFPNAYLRYSESGTTVTFEISPSAREGFVPIWKNHDETIPTGAYVACYNNSKSTADTATSFDFVGSFTGKAPVVSYNRNNYMAKATYAEINSELKMLNATMPLNAYNYVTILGMIVLGTRNFQSIYGGINGDVYKTPSSQSSANKTFTVADMTLSVGDKVTLYYAGGYAWCTREITAVDSTTYTYDGDAIPSITYVSYRAGIQSGITDSISGLFGEDSTLSSGRRPFKIFGIENLYGNLWEITGNASIQGSESPYTKLYKHQYDDYDYSNPNTEYSSMTDTGVNIPTSNGYAKTIGFADSTFITTEIGGDASTYYSDYFYQSTGSNNRSVLFGGGFDFVSFVGPFGVSCYNDWLHASWSIASRCFLLVD